MQIRLTHSVKNVSHNQMKMELQLEIFKRLNNLKSGFFLELGVGDGTENNTLILLSLGWKGVWVGGSDLAFETSSSKKLKFYKNWITVENILSIVNKGLNHLKVKELDLISVDLDGNDFHIVEKILNSGFFPKVFILEYNAKFPPPVEFKINYNPEHQWKNDDYFGTSLESWNSLLKNLVTDYYVVTLKRELIAFLLEINFLNFSKMYRMILIKSILNRDIFFIKTLAIKKALN